MRRAHRVPGVTHRAGALAVLRSERGLTLTELMIVGILAVLVMLSLTGFYFNAQRMWLQGSTQAMTQREATLLMDVMGSAVHQSWGAVVDQSDSSFHRLSLYADKNAALPWVEFAVDGTDHRVHRYQGGSDESVIDSEALRFHVETQDSNLVVLQLAELKSQEGDVVRVSTRFQLMGR